MEKTQINLRTLRDVRRIFQREKMRIEINNCLSELSEEDRTIIELHYRNNLSRKKIALQFDCSERTLDKIFRTALLQLRSHFDPDYYDEANRILYDKKPNRIQY